MGYIKNLSVTAKLLLGFGLLLAQALLFPLAIMSCVLFSVFGVYWLFWLTGTEFNIMAIIGILVLMGVVVNNGRVGRQEVYNLHIHVMGGPEPLSSGMRRPPQ